MKYDILKLLIFSFSILIYKPDNLVAQPSIRGEFYIDSTWAPMAYLSYIPSLEKMFTMSNELIIEEADIDNNGIFSFNTSFLPGEDRLYRIHITKKGYPPASLIIGGKEENHFFVIASKTSEIWVQDKTHEQFLNDVAVSGYYPNQMLQQINEMIGFIDTATFDSSTIKKELIKKGLSEKLRSIADTCMHPLVSLYALSKSNFEPDIQLNPTFYHNYLERWENENSSYFKEFRKRVPTRQSYEWVYRILISLVSLTIGIFAYHFTIKLRNHNEALLKNLTIQERRILTLINNGKSNKEIAQEFNIGLSTVKSHVNNIYSKLNVKSRKEIVNLKL